MTRKNGSASAVAPAVGETPTKSEDDKQFLSRWIAYGRMLKAKGDGFGIEWRKMTFEQYEAAIVFAEEFAKPQGEMEHA